MNTLILCLEARRRAASGTRGTGYTIGIFKFTLSSLLQLDPLTTGFLVACLSLEAEEVSGHVGAKSLRPRASAAH